jgi:hypothetical protein
MKRRPVIDPDVPLRRRGQIRDELLRFVPGTPDDTDVSDAWEVAGLLMKQDWVIIKRVGAWLFSNELPTKKDALTGKSETWVPSNDFLGQLRVQLQKLETP